MPALAAAAKYPAQPKIGFKHDYPARCPRESNLFHSNSHILFLRHINPDASGIYPWQLANRHIPCINQLNLIGIPFCQFICPEGRLEKPKIV